MEFDLHFFIDLKVIKFKYDCLIQYILLNRLGAIIFIEYNYLIILNIDFLSLLGFKPPFLIIMNLFLFEIFIQKLILSYSAKFLFYHMNSKVINRESLLESDFKLHQVRELISLNQLIFILLKLFVSEVLDPFFRYQTQGSF